MPDDNGRPSSKACRKAIKIMTEYERLANKLGRKIPPDRLSTLNAKRSSGQLRPSDLPGFLQRELPGEFDNLSLAEIRAVCKSGGGD